MLTLRLMGILALASVETKNEVKSEIVVVAINETMDLIPICFSSYCISLLMIT